MPVLLRCSIYEMLFFSWLGLTLGGFVPVALLWSLELHGFYWLSLHQRPQIISTSMLQWHDELHYGLSKGFGMRTNLRVQYTFNIVLMSTAKPFTLSRLGCWRLLWQAAEADWGQCCDRCGCGYRNHCSRGTWHQAAHVFSGMGSQVDCILS